LADDLDLYVKTPNNYTIYWSAKLSADGGKLEADATNFTTKASRVENIYFPMFGSPTGNYTYWVKSHKLLGEPDQYKLTAYLNETVMMSDTGVLKNKDEISDRFTYVLT
jgi:hypothetical protein